MMSNLNEGETLALDFSKRGGLLPVVVQDSLTGEILMVAYSNQEAFDQTLTSKKATFFSTSRKEIWTKGATSEDFLEVETILVDCDQDALVYKVKLLGDGVCHTFRKDIPAKHRKSCFYRSVDSKTNTLIY